MKDMVKTFRAILHTDTGKMRVITAASSENAAREIIGKSEHCPDCAIIDIKENGPAWSALTLPQLQACALLAYYRFFDFNNKPNETPEGKLSTRGAITAAEHACHLFKVPTETIFQIQDGVIKGLLNLNKVGTPGAVYTENYLFNPNHR